MSKIVGQIGAFQPNLVLEKDQGGATTGRRLGLLLVNVETADGVEGVERGLVTLLFTDSKTKAVIEAIGLTNAVGTTFWQDFKRVEINTQGDTRFIEEITLLD